MIEHSPVLPRGAPSTTVDGRPAIELRGITKRFPGVVANNDITLDIFAGEIHVLLGENGAGKSTLIGILAACNSRMQARFACTDARSRSARRPKAWISTSAPFFNTCSWCRALQCWKISCWAARHGGRCIRRPALDRFRELSDLLGVAIDPDAPVGRLALGEQQQVEIMHALWRGASVLILDEPTSMLTPQGVHHLGEVMKRLRDKGVAIIFITHKMREACALGDRISVLRLGRRRRRHRQGRTCSHDGATDNR